MRALLINQPTKAIKVPIILFNLKIHRLLWNATFDSFLLSKIFFSSVPAKYRSYSKNVSWNMSENENFLIRLEAEAIPDIFELFLITEKCCSRSPPRTGTYKRSETINCLTSSMDRWSLKFGLQKQFLQEFIQNQREFRDRTHAERNAKQTILTAEERTLVKTLKCLSTLGMANKNDVIWRVFLQDSRNARHVALLHEARCNRV